MIFGKYKPNMKGLNHLLKINSIRSMHKRHFLNFNRATNVKNVENLLPWGFRTDQDEVVV